MFVFHRSPSACPPPNRQEPSTWRTDYESSLLCYRWPVTSSSRARFPGLNLIREYPDPQCCSSTCNFHLPADFSRHITTSLRRILTMNRVLPSLSPHFSPGFSLACRLTSVCTFVLFRISVIPPLPALSLFRFYMPRELCITFDDFVVDSLERSDPDRTQMMGLVWVIHLSLILELRR